MRPGTRTHCLGHHRAALRRRCLERTMCPRGVLRVSPPPPPSLPFPPGPPQPIPTANNEEQPTWAPAPPGTCFGLCGQNLPPPIFPICPHFPPFAPHFPRPPPHLWRTVRGDRPPGLAYVQNDQIETGNSNIPQKTREKTNPPPTPWGLGCGTQLDTPPSRPCPVALGQPHANCCQSPPTAGAIVHFVV